MAKKKLALQAKKFINRVKRLFKKESRDKGLAIFPDTIKDQLKIKRMMNFKASKDEIKKIKENLRNAKYVNKKTGETVDYDDINRRNAKDIFKADTLDFYNTVIDQFFDSMSKYNDTFILKMRKWIDVMIANYGENAVSQMLIDAVQEGGVELLNKMAYSDAEREAYMADLMDYLKMDARTREDVLDSIYSDIDFDVPE